MTAYGIVGFGRIGQRLAARLPGAVAVLTRSRAASGGDARGGARVCGDLAEFLGQRPQVVVECASRAALAEVGPAVLAAGCDLIPLSLTAFAEPDIERRLLAAAQKGPGRLEIAPGAIGTLDLLATAREEGLTRVVYRQLKPPIMWKLVRGAPLDIDSTPERTVFLRGSVRNLSHRFPDNLNTSVGVALAGLGLDRTEVELVADPALSETAHELEVYAAPGKAVLKLGGRDVPPDGDPADYTTFSVMRLVKRRCARLAI